MVERHIRYFRRSYNRYFVTNNTRDWSSSFLATYVKNYNSRKHSTTKQRPIDVQKAGPDSETAWVAFKNIRKYHTKRLEKMSESEKKVPPEFGVGRYVKLSRNPDVFEKESNQLGTFTEEIFKIRSIKQTQTLPVFIVEDLNGELVHGSFYKWELSRFDYNPQALFPVEAVLDRRKSKRGGLQMLVKFRGYGKRFNRWMPQHYISNL